MWLEILLVLNKTYISLIHLFPSYKTIFNTNLNDGSYSLETLMTSIRSIPMIPRDTTGSIQYPDISNLFLDGVCNISTPQPHPNLFQRNHELVLPRYKYFITMFVLFSD